jgi:hypothetical protein
MHANRSRNFGPGIRSDKRAIDCQVQKSGSGAWRATWVLGVGNEREARFMVGIFVFAPIMARASDCFGVV